MTARRSGESSLQQKPLRKMRVTLVVIPPWDMGMALPRRSLVAG